MELENSTSEICQFYRDKHVLLTGATGLLGKLIIEKLLRVCKPAMIYLIIRTKKSKDPQVRLNELTESKLFHRLKREDPLFMKRLKIVSGDLSEAGLGLSSYDEEHLLKKVQIVLHGAATVRFDEPLSTATKINVLGTKTMLELCKKIKNLESVVHISTAYSHCPRKVIKEEFYDTPMSSEGLIGLADHISSDILDTMTRRIIGKWINTYVFTKAVGEETVRKDGEGLPIAIMRPGIILTTRSEPIPNWVDHLYGPMGLAAGSYSGVIRVLRFCDLKGELVPADMTVNCLLAIGYKTAKLRKSHEIPIYNFTSHPSNRVEWTYLHQCLKERATEIPCSWTYWYYPSVLVTKSRLIYYFLAFFLHIVPAIIMDIGLVIINKKPRALQMYNKIHIGQDLLADFSTKTWEFSMDNAVELWESLNDEDKRLFDFDMESLDYKPFLKGHIDGIMLYLLKDDEKDVEYRRRRYFWVYVFDCIARFILLSGLIWCLWRILDYWLRIIFH